MPKSPIRKKEKAYIPESVAQAAPAPTESPKWLAPAMVAAFIAGLIWIVIFYVTADKRPYPIPGIGTWNMLVGFGFIAVGFGLATRWR